VCVCVLIVGVCSIVNLTAALWHKPSKFSHLAVLSHVQCGVCGPDRQEPEVAFLHCNRFPGCFAVALLRNARDQKVVDIKAKKPLHAVVASE